MLLTLQDLGRCIGSDMTFLAARTSTNTKHRDTFVGTYALEFVRQRRKNSSFDIKKAVQRGCRAAARTLLELGAQDAIPWADEIEDECDSSKL